MRLRKLQAQGDYLWGVSRLSMLLDRVSYDREKSEISHVIDFLRDKYLHRQDKDYGCDWGNGTVISADMAFADYDFAERDRFYQSGASDDLDACRNFGDYLRTHFPRQAHARFGRNVTTFREVDSDLPPEQPDTPSYEGGLLRVTLIRSPDVVQGFHFIKEYTTPRLQEIFREIVQGQRARYDSTTGEGNDARELIHL